MALTDLVMLDIKHIDPEGHRDLTGQPSEGILAFAKYLAQKHVPVWSREGNLVKVQVGSAAHPMVAAHYIEWVSLQTKAGNQRKALAPDQAPEVTFALTEGDEVEAVYAYCNLHGLWKA